MTKRRSESQDRTKPQATARARAVAVAEANLRVAADELAAATMLAKAAIPRRTAAVTVLRRAGWTWDAIALVAGVSRQSIMPPRII